MHCEQEQIYDLHEFTRKRCAKIIHRPSSTSRFFSSSCFNSSPVCPSLSFNTAHTLAHQQTYLDIYTTVVVVWYSYKWTRTGTGTSSGTSVTWFWSNRTESGTQCMPAWDC